MRRCESFARCDPEIVYKIEAALRNSNARCKAFRSLKDVVCLIQNNGESILSLSFTLVHDDTRDDQRRFGPHIHGGVGIVFRDSARIVSDATDVDVHTIDGKMCKVPDLSPLTDPAVFVLLYSNGGEGCKPGIPLRQGIISVNDRPAWEYNRVTLSQFYSFIFQYR